MISLATNATWQDVALTLIAALPGLIAAMSSLKNGQAIQRNQTWTEAINRKVDQVNARVSRRQ